MTEQLTWPVNKIDATTGKMAHMKDGHKFGPIIFTEGGLHFYFCQDGSLGFWPTACCDVVG